jgi:hypothetical protein
MAKKELSELRNVRKEQQRRADDRFTWRVLGALLFVGLLTFLRYRFDIHIVLYTLPVGAAVLVLLFYIYPKDFNILAVFISGGAAGLWLLSILYEQTGRWNIAACAVYAAFVALSAFSLLLLRKYGGFLTIGKMTISVIPRRGKYVFLFLACAALALALACAVIFGRSAAVYAIIALFCYLFIAMVYYTVRLI